MKRTITAAVVAAAAATALAPAAAAAPEGRCIGGSDTYPWAVPHIWSGKTFDGRGGVINQTVIGDAVPGVVTGDGGRWQIDYEPTTGLPVVDTLTDRGDGTFGGDIFVAGHRAGHFTLDCR